MIRTVRLYGELGKKYGRVHKLHVASVSEAVRALSANFKDFQQHLVDSDKRIAGYEVWDGKLNLSDEDKESFSLCGKEDIKIIPRVIGSSNAVRIVAGAALVALAIWNPMGWLAIGTKGAFGLSVMLGMGTSLMLGGVVGLMTKTASGMSIDSGAENSESYIFSGPVNSTKQGSPLKIGYGKMVVGSQVISASLTTSDIPV